jgi:hypothetical protein
MWQYIARHCANGAGMQKGVDYAESYAPVATACSIRIVVALAAGHNMTIGIADVKNAFQNTMLPVGQRAHLTMPPYYLQWFRRKYPMVKIEPLASEADKYCLQSINAIQGTKPAGNQWNKILTNVLQHHKYKQNPIDHAVFVYHSSDMTQTQIICVSTDDFLCAFTHQSLFDDLCTSLKKYFELTTKEGPELSYLNLSITQTSEYIAIDQTKHIKEIVESWFPETSNIHTTDTPFRTDNEFEKALSEALPAEPDELLQLEKQYNGPYRTTLGQFQHLKEWTRPELSYATTRLGSFNVAPTEPAFQGLKRIARYLATHPDKPFYYPKNVSLEGTNQLRHEYDHAEYDELTVLNALECFQDAGLARDLTDRRSMAACFHFLYGVAVSWKIGKQPAVAAHSTDAELRAMFMALKRTVAFRHFLEYLGYAQALPAPTRHHEDNQPSIDIISANKVTSRVRHVHIPICYMHYHYDRGTFAPSFCKGTLMCADICTKPTAGPLHHRHFNWLRGARFCLLCTETTKPT